MTTQETRQAVCNWSRQCYAEKLFAGTSGNLSVYDREQGLMVITPTSIPYEAITPEDMVVLRLDGEALEGKHRPSSEWRMHAAVYEARPEASALIHTHSPYATAFAVNNRNIPVILIEMVLFLGGEVPLAKYAMPGTRGVGDEAAAVLKDRGGCLLANHGVLAVGDSLEQAHLRAVYIEDAAKICSIAMGNGPIAVMTEDQINDMLLSAKGNHAAAETGTGRAAAFERMYADLLRERDQVLAGMDRLREAGKQKSATYQQLLAQKLTLQNFIGRLEAYGIRPE